MYRNTRLNTKGIPSESIGNPIRIHRICCHDPRESYRSPEETLSEFVGNPIRISRNPVRIQRKSYHSPKEILSESIGNPVKIHIPTTTSARPIHEKRNGAKFAKTILDTRKKTCKLQRSASRFLGH